jgi:hypothetical protein
MPTTYVLDTNAYAVLFQMPRSGAYRTLEEKLRVDGVMRFTIPVIVSMEIHSVLGKFRRGGASENNSECGRPFIDGEKISACSNLCYYPKRNKMKSKVFRALQKLVNDIENQNGDIQATLLPLEQSALEFGKIFLQKHSHQYSFGSHDALVAGTVAAGIANGQHLTLITSDKGLKALCRDQNIEVFDPMLG